MSFPLRDDEDSDATGKPSLEIIYSTGNAWLESLMPMVHEVSATASYESVFVGSSFGISADGRIVTARHVAGALANYWNQTSWEVVSNRAHATALYLPTQDLIQIYSLTLFDEGDTGPDLAYGQLALPAGSQGELQEMKFLEMSPRPVVEGEEVTLVGFTHPEESSFIKEGTEVFASEGQLSAIHAVVTEVHDAISHISAPVFRMDCEIFGGMSGGPIFRRGTSEVVGVCVRGTVDAQGGEYCYGLMIAPFLTWLTQP